MWETNNEINNDFFTIEKTTDGIVTNEIGRINGAGNSFQPIQYFFIDTNANNILSYYRLKQTDYDGKYKYFDFIAASCNNYINGIIIWPNPNNGLFTINSEIPINSVFIYNVLGEVVFKKEESFMNYNISLTEKIENGVYFLRTGNSNNTVKIIVNKQ